MKRRRVSAFLQGRTTPKVRSERGPAPGRASGNSESPADGISAAHPHHAVPRELCTANDETLAQSHECSSRPDERDVSDRILPPSTSLTSNLPEKQADSTVLCGGSDLRADLSPEVGPICMPISIPRPKTQLSSFEPGVRCRFYPLSPNTCCP